MTMKKSFEQLTRAIASSLGQLQIEAEDVHRILDLIDRRLETLANLASQMNKRTRHRGDQLENESLWTRLVVEGNIDVGKQQRNLRLLDRFQPMIKKTSNQLGHLIAQLTSFKETTSSLQDSSFLSIDEQQHQLKDSLNSLTELKRKWINKQKEQKRS